MKKAVIDIGTNSCRLFIAEVNNKKIENKILKLMKITQLGEGVDKNKKLSDIAMDRTIKVLKRYKKEIIRHSVGEVKVVATSATRDAKNKDFFINKVKDETGLEVRCITGEEEGMLSFKGCVSDFDREILVFDIGGGSTEFILGNKLKIDFIKSFDVGAVRIKEKFFRKDMEEGKKWVFSLLNDLQRFEKNSYKLVGVAGTVTTHVSVLLGMETYETNRVHMYSLKRDEIEKNLKRFENLSLENRKKILGLHPKRASIIIPGTYLLLWIMEILGKEEIIVSDSDILEGLMSE